MGAPCWAWVRREYRCSSEPAVITKPSRKLLQENSDKTDKSPSTPYDGHRSMLQKVVTLNYLASKSGNIKPLMLLHAAKITRLSASLSL